MKLKPAFAVEPLGEARACGPGGRCRGVCRGAPDLMCGRLQPLPPAQLRSVIAASSFNSAAPAATRPRRAPKACGRAAPRCAGRPCRRVPARIQATISVSSHNSRWAWLPPIRASLGISRFEDADRACHCRLRRTPGCRDRARSRQPPGASLPSAARASSWANLVSSASLPRCRRDQREMDIGKVRTSLREVFSP